MSDFLKAMQQKFKEAVNTRNLVDGMNASSLNNAVRAENFARIKMLIQERGYDPNAYNLAGETPFHEAIKTGSVTLAKFLIELGADPLLPCRGAYQNPLHVAVNADQPRMVSFLRALGVPLNQFSSNGLAPLHHAVDHDRPEVIKALIQAGANPLIQTKTGRTATMMAIAQNKPDILQALLSEPQAHISFLSSYYEDFDKLEPPLALAIQLGRNDMVKTMIEAGLGVNHLGRGGKTPLHYAVEYQNFDILCYLLRRGADVSKATDEKGQTPLHLLCRGKKDKDDTPFFDQAFNMMMAYSGDPSVKDDRGYTPLYWLAYGPDITPERFEAFLKAGADIKDCAPDFVAPLPWRLVTIEQVDCLKLLLDSGRIKIDDVYGAEQLSLMHLAVQQNRLRVIDMLLEYKPDLSLRNKAGETAIDISSKYNNRALGDRLLDAKMQNHQSKAAGQDPKQHKPPKPN